MGLLRLIRAAALLVVIAYFVFWIGVGLLFASGYLFGSKAWGGGSYMPTTKNWGLANTKGVSSHIDVEGAWQINRGNRTVIVGVVDTGVDPNHPDLSANMWRDPSVEGRSVFGWNYVTDKPNPLDEHGHGTHVAGIIGGITNVKAGTSGVSPLVSMIAVRYYSDANPGAVNLRNTIDSLNYVINHGARIINYSGGGPEFAEGEYIELKKAQSRGILVVVAAGNEHQNTDMMEHYYYPGSYHLPNMIVVSAHDIRGQMLPSSNWGRKTVDLTAPGENIYSTLPGGRYGYLTGTSQATAFVTGVAALMLAEDPSLEAAEIREIILATVHKVKWLAGKTTSGGMLNAGAALKETRLRRLRKFKPCRWDGPGSGDDCRPATHREHLGKP